jgi:hypothetical protein
MERRPPDFRLFFASVVRPVTAHPMLRVATAGLAALGWFLWALRGLVLVYLGVGYVVAVPLALTAHIWWLAAYCAGCSDGLRVVRSGKGPRFQSSSCCLAGARGQWLKRQSRTHRPSGRSICCRRPALRRGRSQRNGIGPTVGNRADDGEQDGNDELSREARALNGPGENRAGHKFPSMI